jgi:predicted enzyme related to lactoylglutathione lyase
MLNLSSILIFSESPKLLADFYQKILQNEPDWVDHEYYGFTVGKTMLSIGPHDKVKGKNKSPERIMINFESHDVLAEFKRVKSLGAKVVAEPYKMAEDWDGWIATFADPDGNYFQLMSPWDEKN